MGNKESRDKECSERMQRMLEEARQKKLLVNQQSQESDLGSSGKLSMAKSCKTSSSGGNSNRDQLSVR